MGSLDCKVLVSKNLTGPAGRSEQVYSLFLRTEVTSDGASLGWKPRGADKAKDRVVGFRCSVPRRGLAERALVGVVEELDLWHWRQTGAKRWRTRRGPAKVQQGPTKDREGATTKPAPRTIPTVPIGTLSENITSDLAWCKIAAITRAKQLLLKHLLTECHQTNTPCYKMPQLTVSWGAGGRA